jgi:hypothetical protein
MYLSIIIVENNKNDSLYRYMNNNINILREYRDKTYIYQLLTTKTNEYYSQIKQIINLPLIISSSIMTICNSGSFDPESMKIPNITINAVTALLISLINNYKIIEKQQTFRNLSLKYMTLLHDIEDKIANDSNIEPDEVRSIIKQYDDLISQTEYIIPSRIQKKIKKQYQGKKHLPLILNGDCSDTPSRQSSSMETQQQIIICDLQNTNL